MEFNPNNPSFHPVVVALDDSSSNSQALTSADRIADPWKNLGEQTMYCSDCHGDDSGGTTAGPHGSNNKYLLKGEGAAAVSWPLNPLSGIPWNLAEAKSSELGPLVFCNLCHLLDSSSSWGGSGGNSVHGNQNHNGSYCVNCHSAVPHGSNHKRLIVYSNDPAPYDYQNSYAEVTNFTWQADASYTKFDCDAGCAPQH